MSGLLSAGLTGFYMVKPLYSLPPPLAHLFKETTTPWLMQKVSFLLSDIFRNISLLFSVLICSAVVVLVVSNLSNPVYANEDRWKSNSKAFWRSWTDPSGWLHSVRHHRQGHSLNTQVPTCCHLSSVDYLLINQKEKKQQQTFNSVSGWASLAGTFSTDVFKPFC